MQSFKYDIPPGTPMRRRKRGPGRLMMVGALGAIGLLAVATAPRVIAVGNLGWPLRPAAPVHADAPKADVALHDGANRLRAGAILEAIQHFDDALRADPTDLMAYRRGLDARALAGQVPPTLAVLLPDPAARETFLLARSADQAARRPAAALDDCEEALAIAPTDPRALRARAALIERDGDLTTATAAYEQALKVAPKDPVLASGLVRMRFRAGDVDRAQADLRDLLLPLAGTPDPAVHEALLGASIEQDLAPEAVHAAHLAAAPGVSEGDRRLYTARAYLAHYQENANWHRESFDRAMDAALSLTRPELHATPEQQTGAREVMLAALALKADRQVSHNDAKGARETLDRALRLKPAAVPPAEAARFADLYVARAHLASGEAAVKLMQAAIALVPTHPARQELARMDANLGVTLLGSNKVTQALGPLAKAVALAPDDVRVLARYHQALAKAGADTPLQSCTRTLHAADRGDVAVAILQGYARNHQPNAAQGFFNAAGPKLSPAQRLRARAELLAATGHSADAATYYRQSLRTSEDAGALAAWRRLAELDAVRAAHASGKARLALLQKVREDGTHALALGGDERDRGKLLGAIREASRSALAAGDVDGARQAAQEGLQLDADNPTLALSLAAALTKGGQTDGAIAACRAGIEGLAGPGGAHAAELHERLGSLYRAQKRYAEAVTEYRRGLETAAHATPALSSELTYGLALAHAGNGEREEALNAIRQYIAASAHDPHQAARVAQLQTLELDLTARGRG